MLKKSNYMMEHAGECSRLEMKTRAEQVTRQALRAGIATGMNVLDAGCGVGKTTAILKDLVGDSGKVTGVDVSIKRIEGARARYQRSGINFLQHDLLEPIENIQTQFDAVWMRFLLEYFRDDPLRIVSNCIDCLKPGGILVLIDLDNNSMNHYGMPPELERTMLSVITHLQEHHNFDPFAGRKLYSHLYDLGFENIEVEVEAHHNIYGPLETTDESNWVSKVMVACKNSGCAFEEFGGTFNTALEAFRVYFQNPRRYTYTPLILARGTKA